MRVVSYVRVSSDEQAEKYGPDVQRDEIARFVAREGLDLVGEYADLGVSGTTPLEARPGLTAALEAVKNRDASALLVARFDRIARDTFQALSIERAVLAAGGNVLYAEGDGGPFIREVNHAMASEQRRQLVERLLAARERKAAQGGYAGGGTPYGYVSIGGKLRPDPATEPVARKMFELAAAGASPGEIVRHLANAPTPKGGKGWSRQVIHGILRNPTYAGEMHGVKKAHPAIVSRQVFNRAQAALDTRRKGGRDTG